MPTILAMANASLSPVTQTKNCKLHKNAFSQNDSPERETTHNRQICFNFQSIIPERPRNPPYQILTILESIFREYMLIIKLFVAMNISLRNITLLDMAINEGLNMS